MFLGKDWKLVRSRIKVELETLRLNPEDAPPLVVQKLLISGEDHRNSYHNGYDCYAICRAIWRRVTGKSIEGASTIEQQIVRIITNKYERTFTRKIKEILLASLLAHEYPKKMLPVIYLQIAYYGWRMEGFAITCRRLGINPANICITDAASLVARLKYPEPKMVPHKRVEQIEMRKKHLLKLYSKHNMDGTYDHLESHAICVQHNFKVITRTASEGG